MNDIQAWLNGVDEGQEWPDIYKHAPTYLSRAHRIINHINTRNEILRLGQRMTDIIEQAAQVLSTLTTCDGEPNATELHRRQALALADAGLLAQPMPDREQIADTIYDALENGGWYSVLGLYPYEVANAVLDLLKGQES